MKNMVDSFYPSGNTNQGIGLAHGRWMSLVGGGPYPRRRPKDPNYKYQKIIILMSDGLNTQNRWYSTNQSDQIDARQKLTCDQRQGRRHHDLHHARQHRRRSDSTLLKNCASSPGQVHGDQAGEPDGRAPSSRSAPSFPTCASPSNGRHRPNCKARPRGRAFACRASLRGTSSAWHFAESA